MSHQLNEGLRKQDLANLMSNKIHFDEYDSKMGDPDDVITASFKVKQKMPSQDLVNFIENGYDWVLDADVSPGEIDDGEFLVFLEMPRRSRVFEQLTELLDDLSHLTNISLGEWKFRWYKEKDYHHLDETAIRDYVPDSPSKYRQFIEQFNDVETNKQELSDELSQIKKLSGIE